jgi:hypothetical protein
MTAAQIIVAGIEQNRTRILAGRDATLMDLLYRFLPGYTVRLIAKKMQSLLQE